MSGKRPIRSVTGYVLGYPSLEVPAPFRRPQVIGDRVVRPVNGGRWNVRKYKGDVRGRPWRAWSTGLSRGFSAYFETHAEAVAYAVKISNQFAEMATEKREHSRQAREDRARVAAERREARERRETRAWMDEGLTEELAGRRAR